MRNLSKILLSVALMASFANTADDECKKGDAKACFASAKNYDDQNNIEKALEFYSISCFMDYPLACSKIGEKNLAANDIANAKKFYSKACDLNHHESCVNLGEIFESEGNCDKASEIYKDTFTNKKFKQAQVKFEALIGSKQCMSEELKKQKEEGEKAKAKIEEAKIQIEEAKMQIELSKKELEITKQQMNSQAQNNKMSKDEILAKIFTRDIIGSTVAYLEQFTGIPKQVSDYNNKSRREYHIENCIITVYSDQNNIRSLELEVSDECTFDISKMIYFDSKYYAHQLTYDKIYDVLGEYSVKFTSDCLYGCGNAAVPLSYLEYTGPHADNWIEARFSTNSEFDGSSCWANYMEEREGVDYLINYEFSKDKKYDKIAYECFKGNKIDTIRIGYDIFNN
ncbi:hypothetical protein OFO10_03395 [Campylobacter sp. VBCF_06 NA8]|uniref:hypothetical protein n=1 Tax=Campylobacter sp. VBCF_06 NA8 TaxID=2983822 RepID=UPI0022E9B250|nr:hypothetical protein [Campylobacter sp. VBCF_06 NA8]MDA3046193.1 hypothetical protein [Campylobacter sp. VBCF_06 NA8]